MGGPLSSAQINDMISRSSRGELFAPKPKKKIGGLSGFLVNNLPAIGGGLGAVAGLPGALFSGGASAVGGGAIGAGLGETLKRKLLGESLDAGQIGIQALEGGAFAGLGGALKGASSAAKGFVSGGG